MTTRSWLRSNDSGPITASATPHPSGSPAGLVNAGLVELMWAELDGTGKTAEIRQEIRNLTAVRR